LIPNGSVDSVFPDGVAKLTHVCPGGVTEANGPSMLTTAQSAIPV
jgi:hypothetical protein